MAKVSIAALDKATPVSCPDGMSGCGDTRAFFAGDGHPLHLHLHRLKPGETLRIGPRRTECLGYVWHGAVEAGGETLPAGSSLIVENGASLAVTGAGGGAELLSFAAAKSSPAPRAGGHVHLLPVARVPRNPDLGGVSGVGGGMHADAGCPTCEVWLHENRFPASDGLTAEDAARGIHSHSEDELIFVTEGRVCLGNRLFDTGTAVAIAADTLYSLSAGPEGMTFVNFRAAKPGDIRFVNGMRVDEPAYWRERVARPEYLEPA